MSEHATEALPTGSSIEVPTTDNIIWIFSFARSGTTWLASMIGGLPGRYVWDEPYVGALFGQFYDRYNGEHQGENFILGRLHREVWLTSIRSMVLEGARARFPRLSPVDYLVIKEPHGSLGAPLLMEAVPESRLILVIRDPRDVAASNLDSQRQGSWTAHTRQWKNRTKPPSVADVDPDRAVAQLAKDYVHQMNAAVRAFDLHSGRKSRVTYEALRAEPLVALKRVHEELEIPFDATGVAQVVEQHAWERIPPDKRGPGRFFRRGAPGAWREDLTEKQAAIVERIAAEFVDPYVGA
jgi:sulfotransferase family protein